eukprot:403340545
MRRRWYKLHVDMTFDVNYGEPAREEQKQSHSQQSQQSNNHQNASSSQQEQRNENNNQSSLAFKQQQLASSKYRQYMDLFIQLKDILQQQNMTITFSQLDIYIQPQFWEGLPLIRSWIEKGLMHKEYLRNLRSDFEIFIGIYLTVRMVITFKISMLIWVAIYWQYMRLRYFLSLDGQLAFSRMNTNLLILLRKPSCPQFAKDFYQTLMNYVAYQTDLNIVSKPGFKAHCSIF